MVFPEREINNHFGSNATEVQAVPWIPALWAHCLLPSPTYITSFCSASQLQKKAVLKLHLLCWNTTFTSFPLPIPIPQNTPQHAVSSWFSVCSLFVTQYRKTQPLPETNSIFKTGSNLITH